MDQNQTMIVRFKNYTLCKPCNDGMKGYSSISVSVFWSYSSGSKKCRNILVYRIATVQNMLKEISTSRSTRSNSAKQTLTSEFSKII